MARRRPPPGRCSTNSPPTPALFPQVGSYPSAVLADNPELYYRLGERSGTTAVDSSANANNGIYQGGATHGTPGVTADGNTAVTLNGTSGYVSNATSGSTRWCSPKRPDQDDDHDRRSDRRVRRHRDRAARQLRPHDLRGRHQASSTFGIALNQTTHSPNAYNDGSWHLVDATLSPAGMALYVDGALVSTNTKTTIPQLYNGYWRIGYESTGGWSAHVNNFFTGTIDEPAVYPSALSPVRIAAHYLAAR